MLPNVKKRALGGVRFASPTPTPKDERFDAQPSRWKLA
jgi:hypothetical protein